jgi:hypothetical protein
MSAGEPVPGKRAATVIQQLEQQARAALPVPWVPGARGQARASVPPDFDVLVVCRMHRHGHAVYDHHCNGRQMDRATLARLLCPMLDCPQSAAVRQRWQAMTGQTLPAERSASNGRHRTLATGHLIDEVTLRAGEHSCVARPALFSTLTACPMAAHPPELLRRSGWDLFEDGVWLAGGVTRQPGGTQAPRFATLDDARRWLADCHREALALVRKLG